MKNTPNTNNLWVILLKVAIFAATTVLSVIGGAEAYARLA